MDAGIMFDLATIMVALVSIALLLLKDKPDMRSEEEASMSGLTNTSVLTRREIVEKKLISEEYRGPQQSRESPLACMIDRRKIRRLLALQVGHSVSVKSYSREASMPPRVVNNGDELAK